MKKDSCKENWATVRGVKIHLPTYRKQHKLIENWQVKEEPDLSPLIENLEESPPNNQENN